MEAGSIPLSGLQEVVPKPNGVCPFDARLCNTLQGVVPDIRVFPWDINVLCFSLHLESTLQEVVPTTKGGFLLALPPLLSPEGAGADGIVPSSRVFPSNPMSKE